MPNVEVITSNFKDIEKDYLNKFLTYLFMFS